MTVTDEREDGLRIVRITDGDDRYYVRAAFVTPYHGTHLWVAKCDGPGRSAWVPAPAGLLAAFEAGEDWGPVLDYVIEAGDPQLDWLPALAARLGAP